MLPTCHIHVQPDIQILDDLDRFVDIQDLPIQESVSSFSRN